MTESKTTDILERALLFASRAKLGEIFFESIPQFLTQLMMTSAKGQGGIRELTLLQIISVMTSAINIAFGISKFVIDSRGQGRRRNYFFINKVWLLSFATFSWRRNSKNLKENWILKKKVFEKDEIVFIAWEIGKKIIAIFEAQLVSRGEYAL